MFAKIRRLRVPQGRRSRTKLNLGLPLAAVLAFGLLAPASSLAQGSTVGVGDMAGHVDFDDPGLQPGLVCPPPGAPVGHLTGDGQMSVVVNTVIKGYFGPLVLEGTTSPTCETTLTGSGLLSLSVTSTDPGPEKFVDCPNLVGTYTRVAAKVIANPSGTCIITGSSVEMQVTFTGEFVPDEFLEGDIGGPITGARYGGVFTMRPL